MVNFQNQDGTVQHLTDVKADVHPHTQRVMERGLPRWCRDKEPTWQCRRHRRLGFNPWVGKIRWRKWQPTPGFLPRESHGQRSLVGYSL